MIVKTTDVARSTNFDVHMPFGDTYFGSGFACACMVTLVVDTTQRFKTKTKKKPQTRAHFQRK